MGRIGMAAVAALTLGACFSKPPPFTGGGGDDEPPIDAPDGDATIDALGSCTMMSAQCTTPAVLETCAGSGATPVQTTCPFTCSSTGTPHCKQFTPAGGAVTAADLAPDASLVDATIGGAFIDGETGEIAGVRVAGTGVVSGIGFEVRGTVGVFRFKSVVISAPLVLRGVSSIALAANGNITVSAVIDGTVTCGTGLQRTAGGSAGGAPGTSPSGPGGGQGGTSTDEGGSGGGHGASGGNGGFNSGAGPLGGSTFSFGALIGGGGGGGGFNGGGAGGSGGAAIQLASNGTVTIASGGGINAGGCGGRPTTANSPGGGGGAGGLILIEAYQVNVAGALAVNGGGGGACENGGAGGANGMLARAIAPGGMAQASTGHGGGGGFGVANNATVLAGQNPPLSAAHGGGGGGGIGRIVIKTSDGMVSATGVMSPAFTDVGTTAVKNTLVTQ